MANYDNKFITLYDEDGNALKFELIDYIEYKNNEYAVLIEEGQKDPIEVTILKVEYDKANNEDSYVGVESEKDLQEVFKIFKTLYEDEFNLED